MDPPAAGLFWRRYERDLVKKAQYSHCMDTLLVRQVRSPLMKEACFSISVHHSSEMSNAQLISLGPS